MGEGNGSYKEEKTKGLEQECIGSKNRIKCFQGTQYTLCNECKSMHFLKSSLVYKH